MQKQKQKTTTAAATYHAAVALMITISPWNISIREARSVLLLFIIHYDALVVPVELLLCTLEKMLIIMLEKKNTTTTHAAALIIISSWKIR